MKKFLSIFLCLISVFCVSFCFTGCDLTDLDLKKENTDIEETTEDDRLILEENTPQSWIDLFTFDNVTILLKNNLTIKKGNTYKCVDSQWYIKSQGATTYESHDGRHIFDLYLTNYSIFTFNSESLRYEASGVSFDNSDYTHEINITVNSSGKIVSIYDLATYNTSTIWTSIDFSDYNTTTLD